MMYVHSYTWNACDFECMSWLDVCVCVRACVCVCACVCMFVALQKEGLFSHFDFFFFQFCGGVRGDSSPQQ